MFFGPLVYVSGYLVLLFLAICMVVCLLLAESICPQRQPRACAPRGLGQLRAAADFA